MKLTNTHILELYKFTKQHFVEHYDVQTELVDHLANDIEQIWIDQPGLSFEESRDKSFKKFGVYGFMNVVEEKQKTMTKRYWKILLRFLKEWFSFPKIIITSCVFILFTLLLQLKEASIILVIIFFVIAVFILVSETIISYKIRKRKKRNQKIFLLEEMIHKTKNGFVITILLNVYYVFNFIKINLEYLSIYWLYFFALFFTLLTISFYITEFVIPQKAEELLEETYPEYKIS